MITDISWIVVGKGNADMADIANYEEFRREEDMEDIEDMIDSKVIEREQRL